MSVNLWYFTSKTSLLFFKRSGTKKQGLLLQVTRRSFGCTIHILEETAQKGMPLPLYKTPNTKKYVI